MNATEPAPSLPSEAPEREDPSKTRNELEEAVASSQFKKAPTLRRLLAYLWEHRDEEVSEYAIATEALGRKANFDPREDATVRVLVSRLRLRLRDFYESAEGAGLSTRIVIPVGSHQVQVIETPRLQVADEPDPDLLPRTLRREARNRKVILAQAIIISLLAITCIGLRIQQNRAVENARQGRIRKLSPFWRFFLEDGKSTRIILPAPVLFEWGTGFLARDVNINDFTKIDDSPWLRTLMRDWGKPILSPRYVSAPDALAVLRLGQYLDPEGSQLTISTTSESPGDTLDRENLIIVGTSRTLAPYQAILNRLNFQMDAEKKVVTDQHPASGTVHAFWTEQQQSPTEITTPGVIACLPGGAQGTHILILVTTYYTSALVSYLTSENGLAELQAAQQSHGGSPYFEAVVSSEINGSTALKSHLVAFRPIAEQH